jgi:hypothetical protein
MREKKNLLNTVSLIVYFTCPSNFVKNYEKNTLTVIELSNILCKKLSTISDPLLAWLVKKILYIGKVSQSLSCKKLNKRGAWLQILVCHTVIAKLRQISRTRIDIYLPIPETISVTVLPIILSFQNLQ